VDRIHEFHIISIDGIFQQRGLVASDAGFAAVPMLTATDSVLFFDAFTISRDGDGKGDDGGVVSALVSARRLREGIPTIVVL
jgi:hypothetical protein